MHNEPVFANFAVFNVQPRFIVVLPQRTRFGLISVSQRRWFHKQWMGQKEIAINGK